jgi:glucose dehydrogenase
LYLSAFTDALPFDVVIIATASNDVLALKAATGETIWQTHLGPPSNALDAHQFSDPLSRHPPSQLCHNTSPLHGVNSTPVIAFGPRNALIYTAFLSTIDSGQPAGVDNDWNQGYFLQALDVVTGTAFFTEPVPLAGS